VEGKDGSTAGSMVVAGATTRDGMEARRHGRQRGAIGVSTATATAGNACRIVPARTRAGGLLCPVHKSRDLRTGRRFTKGACSDLRSRRLAALGTRQKAGTHGDGQMADNGCRAGRRRCHSRREPHFHPNGTGTHREAESWVTCGLVRPLDLLCREGSDNWAAARRHHRFSRGTGTGARCTTRSRPLSLRRSTES
jgi:hypothetical protein